MTGSVQPISSAAMSALIWEQDESAEDIFGASPIGAGGNPTQPILGRGGRLTRVLSRIRRRTLPSVIQSMSTSPITVRYRTRVGDPDDPQAARYSTSDLELFAVISGPSAEALEKQMLGPSDYEVLIPAKSLTFELTENAAILIDGVAHDVVGIRAFPKAPPVVAYKYMCKRVA